MPTRTAPPDPEQELRSISADLIEQQPDIAERLAAVADQLRGEAVTVDDYVSTGQFAAAFNVSVNTVKKWVRMGFVRDVWTMPGSGYLKIASSEIERLRREGTPRIAEVPER